MFPYSSFASKRTLAALLLTTCLAPQLAAQDTAKEVPISLWDNFTAENILTAIVQSMTPSLRMLADIRYEDISVDATLNRVMLLGADIRPRLPYGAPDACTVTADTIMISGAPIDRITGYTLRATLDGVTMDFDCLPNEARPMVGMLGVENLRLDRAHVLIDYDFASGGADVSLGADIDDLIALTGTLDLSYISYKMDFETEDVDPAIYLNHAQVTVEDRGAFAVAQRMLPPNMVSADGLSGMVSGGMRGVLSQMNQGKALSIAQERLIEQASDVARKTATDPGSIVLETPRFGNPVRFSEADIDDPLTLFAKLKPEISTAPLSVVNAIPAATLKQAIDELLPKDQSLKVGQALLTGVGAPRNTTLGLRLLDPLSKDGNADASYLMAKALQYETPKTAYRLAIHAASKGRKGALGLLSKLERDLPTKDVLEIQDAMLGGGGPVASDFAAIGQMRRAARAHLLGTTRPRSYTAAYYWGSVAAAAGDTAGAEIRNTVDDIMRHRGYSAQWREITTSLENGVLRDWVGRDIPSALQQN